MTAGHRRSTHIVEAVRDCVGVRFRSQGRDAATGLDCAGLACIAAAAAGHPVTTLPAYRLDASGLTERLLSGLAGSGLRRLAAAAAAPGDIVLFEVAPGRPHLAILTDTGLVHAHAGLRRVVEGPADPAWRVVGRFRFPEGD
ncbi:MAG: peptidoglycan endopeptidase [Sphingomonadaceae bacterium]